ncbi:MAG: phage tail protein, partial [Gammaproteobacteria bacterium]|nr:phage tail protein [Gammaproteobacteria bacterium]
VAAATPLASQTSNSLTTISQGFSRNSNVNIGTVEVNTQATDAEGVGKALNDTLQDQVSQAIDDFDDGVAG